MTAQTLRQMSHENLIGYVRSRLTTPTPTAAPAEAQEEPHRASHYVRNLRVPAARIQTYPKRRTIRMPQQGQSRNLVTAWESMLRANDSVVPLDEPRYEDFLRTDHRVHASSVA